MPIVAAEKGDFLVVSLSEAIDDVAAKQIGLLETQWIEKKKNIALDFRGVDSVDPSGLRALSSLARKAKGQGLKTVSFNPKKDILSEIKKQGLDSLLNPVKT